MKRKMFHFGAVRCTNGLQADLRIGQTIRKLEDFHEEAICNNRTGKLAGGDRM
jgi:hypothetical protein